LTAEKFLKTERNQMIELLYEMVITESPYKGKAEHINFGRGPL